MFGLFGLFLCFLIIQAGETGGRILPFVGSTELSSEFIARGARPASGPPLSQGKELARAGPQEIELLQKLSSLISTLPRGDGLVEPAWLWESQSRMATPLGPEKYGRIDFSLGRWTTMGQNAPKLVLKHAKEQVELVRIFLRSLLRPQESLFWRSSFICCKKY